MNLAQQSAHWMQQLETRKRRPAAPATIATYRSGLDRWILPRLGQVELAAVKNGVLRSFVAELAAEHLAPASINLWTNAVKAIIASAVNQDGEALYDRKWDNDFIDLPVLAPGSQKQPTVDAASAQRAISTAEPLQAALYALLAGTGMRIAEALALRMADTQNFTAWLPEDRLIRVRTQVYRNQERMVPKTKAGRRDIDLSEKLNDFLRAWAFPKGKPRVNLGTAVFQDSLGGRAHLTTLRKQLAKTGIPGFHCFRRFRTTQLRAARVPEDIISFWIGHGKKDITDRYSMLAQNVEARREWAEKVGLGFELPEAK